MKNIIAIRREGSGKKGEKRVAITPGYAKHITEHGHKLLVQPAVSPGTGDTKRAFTDSQYKKIGAEILEDISKAHIIFGLKEIGAWKILPDKAYYLFSHTHKGQLKNRLMLKTLIENKATLIDYELIRSEDNNRLITAFTYNAGYAGMVDTLWAFGRRLKKSGIKNPFEKIPQAVEGDDLQHIIRIIKEARHSIKKHGTPKELPPVITVFLGSGKTSYGAQEMYNLLPVDSITLNQLPEVFTYGSRKKVYKLVLRVSEFYRLKQFHKKNIKGYENLHTMEKEKHYMKNPGMYESNLDRLLPCASILMNCITWSSLYPRSLSNELMKKLYTDNKTLIAIGDITCDPNGSIEFSKETWIDNPVYVYDPVKETMRDGFDGDGIAVMAVTNLPCEFSADASEQFSKDLFPFLKGIIKADYKGDLKNSKLPDEIKRGAILWKGKFTDEFQYMKKYIS